jgi:hypothetical protein
MIGGATPNPNSGGLAAQIKAALRRDPRRSGLLAILLLILAALWGKMFVGGNAPLEATASSLTPAQQISADTKSSQPISQSKGARTLTQWAKIPSAELDRNLFSVPFEYYSQDPAHPPKSKHTEQVQAKSSATEADLLRERQNLAENLRKAAASLTLEGTVLGANPRAWVNGLLVGIGQPIGDTGFRIARIESRRVFIERDGVQIELSMK